MKKCFTFYFSLYNIETDVDDAVYAFIPINTDTITDQQELIILKSCADKNLEHYPYGVHDVSFGERFKYDNNIYESIFGFSTYEVEKDNI